MSALRRVALLLALLLLPGLAHAQSNGGFIRYTPSPQVLQSLQVIGGTITCGSTTATCIVTFPLTATGGADLAASFQASADLATADTVIRFGDGGNASLQTLDGAGSGLFVGNVTAGSGVAGAGSLLTTGLRIVSRMVLFGGSDGSGSISNSGSTDGFILVGLKRSVEAVTTTKSPATTESEEIYTNIGDADGATVTLPAAAANVCYTFIVEAAQDYNITADASDTIRVAATVTGAGGTIDSSVIGDAITLCGTAAGTWVATAQIGTGFP